MRDVAREAALSVETLYSGFGSKAGLLCAALDVAVVSDDEPGPCAERAEWTAMGAGRTVCARARSAAQVATAINARIYRLDQTLRQGAAVEAVLAERLAASEASRRVAVAEAARLVARRAVTEAEIDELAAVTSSVVYDFAGPVTGLDQRTIRALAGRPASRTHTAGPWPSRDGVTSATPGDRLAGTKHKEPRRCVQTPPGQPIRE